MKKIIPMILVLLGSGTLQAQLIRLESLGGTTFDVGDTFTVQVIADHGSLISPGPAFGFELLSFAFNVDVSPPPTVQFLPPPLVGPDFADTSGLGGFDVEGLAFLGVPTDLVPEILLAELTFSADSPGSGLIKVEGLIGDFGGLKYIDPLSFAMQDFDILGELPILVVPEPSSLGALGILLLLGYFLWRRKAGT
jgi:hypothetical protein